MAGCSVHRHGCADPVTAVSRDSSYAATLHYDRIYVYENHTSDYRRGVRPGKESSCDIPDTVVVKDVSIEYRYRYLRDTVSVVRIDSIPVVREVEVVKEKVRFPWTAMLLAAFLGFAAVILARRN